jgi:hypothetical protein
MVGGTVVEAATIMAPVAGGRVLMARAEVLEAAAWERAVQVLARVRLPAEVAAALA